MRHNIVGRKLGRTHSHRAATLAELATALLRHKKIRTTEAKAKETRRYVEPIITRAKNAVAAEVNGVKNIQARREVARVIHDKEVLTMLFTDIAPRVANRAGGYTRVVKLGQRHGDGAQVAIIELVDYNAAVAVAPEAGAQAAMPKPRPTRGTKKAAAEKPAKAKAKKAE